MYNNELTLHILLAMAVSYSLCLQWSVLSSHTYYCYTVKYSRIMSNLMLYDPDDQCFVEKRSVNLQLLP